MYEKLKNIVKHSAIYSLGNISNKLVGFILLPLYTKELATSEYGVLAILEISIQVLISLFGFNIHSGILRWCSGKENKEEKKSIIFTSLLFLIVISILLIILGVLSADSLSLIIFNNQKYSSYFILITFSSAIAIINQIVLTIMRLEEKSTSFAITNTLKFTVTLIANFYFVAKLNMGIEGILWGTIVGQVILSVTTLNILFKNLILKINLKVLLEILKYSYPLFFSTIGGVVIMVGDRYILKFLSDLSNVGLYSLGYKISSILRVIFINAFQLGFLPIAFKMAEESDAKSYFSKTLTYFGIILIGSALFLTLFGQEVLENFTSNSEYYSAFYVIPIISLGMIFQGLQFVFALGFHISKKTKYIAIINLIGALVYLILNVIFIPIWNFVGSAVAFCLTYFTMAVLSYAYSQKLYYIPYQLKRIIGTLIYFAFSSFIMYSISEYNETMRFEVKLGVILLFPFFLYITKIITNSEIDFVLKKLSLVKKQNN